eukprot:TRINITY_DN30030_c0_g1_i1.p1 TRINITY_DN30030_c0_g1~~TRINITY_DN30030_c0_g1_i1.p1  ORF type:complete len:889 (+),score=351.28 TRINITY_DN30030_c0_g1_i1:82-2748(+)
MSRPYPDRKGSGHEPLRGFCYAVIALEHEAKEVERALTNVGGKQVFAIKKIGFECVLTTKGAIYDPSCIEKLHHYVDQGVPLVDALAYIRQCRESNEKLSTTSFELILPTPQGGTGPAPVPARGMRKQQISGAAPSLRPKPIDFAKNWSMLTEAMSHVLSDPTGTPPWPGGQLDTEKYCKAVWVLCTCPRSPDSDMSPPQRLHSNLQQFLLDHMGQVLQRVQAISIDQSLLSAYLKEWRNFSLGMGYIHAVFHYMNADFCARNTNGQARHDVRTLGYICWRDQLFCKVQIPVRNALLELIQRDREGRPVDGGHQLLSGVIESIVQLGVERRPPTIYCEKFENDFLLATEEFYTKEVQMKLGVDAHDQAAILPEYMLHIEKRLHEEQRRLELYLDRSTEKPLMKRLIKVTIDSHIGTLLDASVAWFDNNRVQEQKRLFRLLERSDGGLEPLRKLIEDRIDREGNEYITRVKNEAQKDPCIYVETILEVYNKYDAMVKEIFKLHPHFTAALDKGCKRFINKNVIASSSGAKSADLLARYAHILLKPNSKAAKARTEKELDEKLTEILTIYGLLEDSDVFQTVYRDKLSQRLIQNTYNEDREKLMINKLKEIKSCSYEYTYKLQRMFTDMEVSQEMNRMYEEFLVKNEADRPALALTTNILTSVSWPQTASKTQFNVPGPLDAALKTFMSFYKDKYQGRCLSWLHAQSNGVLKTLYTAKPYEVHVTTQQAAVLMCFNSPSVDQLTWDGIRQATSLTEREVDLCVQVLVRHKLLLCSGDLKTGNISANMDFQHNTRKVQLWNVQLKDGQQAEDAANLKVVAEDRKYAIQAAIVRLMKSRQTMPHLTLITEVVAQLQATFTPSNQDIKKNIENLIEKDYIERTEDGKSYVYLA